MSVLTLSTYTVHVPRRTGSGRARRWLDSVQDHRLQAIQRREMAAALAGDLGPGQRDDVLAALARR